MPKKNCIILFVKYPRPSRVKTRIAAHIGEFTAARLYRCFVSDMLATLEKSGLIFQVHFYPAHEKKNVAEWLKRDIVYMPQQGGNLGDRMFKAFERVFKQGFDSAVLIGSDLPDLPERILHEAILSLQDAEMVIGPSPDGGFYLLGMKSRALCHELFKDIVWGSKSVLSSIIKNSSELKKRFLLLEAWRDIDRLEDLARFMKKYSSGSNKAPRTLNFLKSTGIKPGNTDPTKK